MCIVTNAYDEQNENETVDVLVQTMAKRAQQTSEQKNQTNTTGSEWILDSIE